MKKVYYTWKQVEGACLDIARQLNDDNWRPDYIVGITRGGLVPATLLSQYMGIKMHTLGISLRDDNEGESNLWMAEDAFGYVNKEDREIVTIEGSGVPIESDPTNPAIRKNILIVDDINDTGATIKWIKEDWPSGCLPNTPFWSDIWGNNVRFAVLADNLVSEEDADYSVWDINKAEEDCWLVFPWEEYWLK
jgi:hypoxanthine-guanine phosphoribosyltransferase